MTSTFKNQYKTGRIYKIIHNQSDICYVGSTFNELKYRFREHKSDYKKFIGGSNHQLSIYPYFIEFGIENFKIVLIKQYEVVDRKHLEMYETLWKSKLKTINKNNAFRIDKLADRNKYWKNKEEINKKKKIYRTENSELLRGRDRERYTRDREKRLEAVKDFYNENKEEINTKRKDKYKNDIEYKEKVLKKRREYMERVKDKLKGHCELCNSTVARLKDHQKTKLHQTNEALYYFNILPFSISF